MAGHELRTVWFRRLIALLTVAVVFVLFALGFARAVGCRPRYAWKGTNSSVVNVSDDGETVITRQIGSGLNDPGMLTLWNARTGSIKKTIELHPNRAIFPSISRDGKLAAIPRGPLGSIEINVHNLDLDEIVATIPVPNVPVSTEGVSLTTFVNVGFTPDDKTLLCIRRAGSDCWISLWDVASGKLRHDLGKIGRPLFRISDDSRTIVALSSEDPTTVNVWDVETGKLTAELSSTETYTGRIVNVLPFVAPDSSCVGIRLMVDVRKSKYDQYALVWDVAAAMVVRRQQDASKVLHLGQYFPSRMFSFRKVADTALAEDLLSRERLQGPLPTGMNRAEIDRIYIGENCHCKWWSVEYPWNEDRFWLQKQTTEPLFRPFAMHARHVREYYDIASGSFLGEIHHHFGMPSYNAEFLATVYTDGTIAVWDTPPRRPVGLILLLAALHTGLIVGACWWWSRRA